MRCLPLAIAGLAALLLAWQGPARAADATTAGPPAVVELFTSQGCNSCPPADALLGELAKRRDVLALTYNVDYWDYLGWRDTLAKPEYTERQQGYAHALGNRTVYTPQMVIGGRIEAVGSDRGAVARAIADDHARTDPRLKIRFDRRHGMVVVRISGSGYANRATIWLALIDRSVEVPVARGENAGHSLHYYRVVRELSSLGLWRGHDMEIALGETELKSADGCAVLVQLDGTGTIIAARQMGIYGGGS